MQLTDRGALLVPIFVSIVQEVKGALYEGITQEDQDAYDRVVQVVMKNAGLYG